VDGATVIAGSEATKMLEASKATLDLVAMLVDGFVMRDEDLSVSLGRDHDLRFHGSDLFT
jgi:hypothetical protein